MTNKITTSPAAVKKAIEWGEHVRERPDLLVSLKHRRFSTPPVKRQTITSRLTEGDYAKEIHCYLQQRGSDSHSL